MCWYMSFTLKMTQKSLLKQHLAVKFSCVSQITDDHCPKLLRFPFFFSQILGRYFSSCSFHLRTNGICNSSNIFRLCSVVSSSLASPKYLQRETSRRQLCTSQNCIIWFLSMPNSRCLSSYR